MSTVYEKHDALSDQHQLEKGDVQQHTLDPDAELSPEERSKAEKSLLRILDWKLIPWLSLLYLISFLDRANIGNTKVYGLEEGLNITPAQYNIALTVFFIPYSLVEPLCNVLLKRFRPRVFIPTIMIVWAICMTCMGLIKNFSGLVTTRFLLGLAEAGLFPGITYYLSCWYRRAELGIRLAIFFSSAAVAGSFGGLLAAAIAQMNGVGNRPGWAWIFILEGLFTILVGIASYWMVLDFPDEAKFLDPINRQRVQYRLQQDKQASAHHESLQSQFVWQALLDWKTYVYMIIYGGCAGSLYAFSLFLPTFIKEIGIAQDATKVTLLTVPHYAAAAVLTIIIGWYSDKTQRRGLCNIGVSLLGISGFAILIGSNSPGVKYAGTFLVALGIYPAAPNTIVWASNNTEGVFKRGVVLGMVIGWGNLNGIVASNVYRSRDSPRFVLGHTVFLGYMVLFQLGGSVIATLLLRSENRLRRNGMRDSWIVGKTEKEIAALGDGRPDFVYTV